MKKYIKIVFVILTVFTTTAQAQEKQSPKNYIFTHIDQSFFGSGPNTTGSTIGINYIRMVYGRFGIYGGYNSTTGGSYPFRYDGESGRPKFENIYEQGDGEHAYDMSLYKSYNIGLTYAVTDGTKSTLLVSSGLNIMNIKDHNASVSSTNNKINEDSFRMYIYSSVEKEFFITLDYLYYFTGNVSIGFHASYEDGHAVSQLGVSLGYRF